MLKQSQNLKLLQKISPQQIQFIKLLQIPVASLEARIKEELEENPALEDPQFSLENDQPSEKEKEDDGDSQEESVTEDDFTMDDLREEEYDYRTTLKSSPDEEDTFIPIASQGSFFEFIQKQLDLFEMPEDQKILAEHLIGSIDDDGYLRRPLRSIANDIFFIHQIKTDETELEEVLETIQRFDPPGIGARNLKECLTLQLERKKYSETNVLALKLVEEYFEEFTKKHYVKIRSGLGISEEELKTVMEVVTKLNPKPGGKGEGNRGEVIIPDFILLVVNGEIDIKLNSRNSPELKVSRSYQKMLKDIKGKEKGSKTTTDKETFKFVKEKLEKAQWFIDAIKQRSFTLLNTMYSIAEKQQEFFLNQGDERFLRPMILKDIAEEIKMDISTVSRVANSKYVQTEWGILPLKYFFTEGITTDDGSEVSNREVKKILQDLIEGESKKKPLSDAKLSALLREKGYQIARRTVAKYREQLNLPVARLRKEI